jgi:putative ABC transport system permease protein
MRGFRKDVGYGARMLFRHPVLMTSAIICLGIGIGVTATMFTILNTLLIQPLPFEEPSRLMWMHENHPQHHLNIMSVSYLNFRDWQLGNTVFEEMTAFTGQDMTATGSFGTHRVVTGRVSENFFDVLPSR